MENYKQPKMSCDLCNEPYNRHMDRLITFKYGDFNRRNPIYMIRNKDGQIKRSHSISEHEMTQLKSLNFINHSEEFHLKETKKKLGN